MASGSNEPNLSARLSFARTKKRNLFRTPSFPRGLMKNPPVERKRDKCSSLTHLFGPHHRISTRKSSTAEKRCRRKESPEGFVIVSQQIARNSCSLACLLCLSSGEQGSLRSECYLWPTAFGALSPSFIFVRWPRRSNTCGRGR